MLDLHYKLEEDGSYTLRAIVVDERGEEVDAYIVGTLAKTSGHGWVYYPDLEYRDWCDEYFMSNVATSLRMLNAERKADH